MQQVPQQDALQARVRVLALREVVEDAPVWSLQLPHFATPGSEPATSTAHTLRPRESSAPKISAEPSSSCVNWCVCCVQRGRGVEVGCGVKQRGRGCD
jgi:hypothetical protein